MMWTFILAPVNHVKQNLCNFTLANLPSYLQMSRIMLNSLILILQSPAVIQIGSVEILNQK